MEGYEVQISQQAGKVQCDFEAAKAYLGERLQEYNGIVFTEDTKAEAKKTVASLRKEKKAFADRVKEARIEYMKPFEAFAEKAGELLEMYDRPIEFINGQVAEFDRARLAERNRLVQQLYEEYLGDMKDILPLHRIRNPKWDNSTTTRKAICEELTRRRQEVQAAMDAIHGMHSDACEKAERIYLETFDLSKAMLYISQYEEQRKQMLEKEQERIRREEEERIRREERARFEAEQREKEALRRAEEEKQEALRRAEEERQELLRRAEEERQRAEAEKQAELEQARQEAAQEAIDGLIDQEGGETDLYEYRMELSAGQKEKLEMYLDSVGIEWEMV